MVVLRRLYLCHHFFFCPENLPDTLCHSTARLPVWLMFCTEWHCCVLRSSKNRLARTDQRAVARMLLECAVLQPLEIQALSKMAAIFRGDDIVSVDGPGRIWGSQTGGVGFKRGGCFWDSGGLMEILNWIAFLDVSEPEFWSLTHTSNNQVRTSQPLLIDNFFLNFLNRSIILIYWSVTFQDNLWHAPMAVFLSNSCYDDWQQMETFICL